MIAVKAAIFLPALIAATLMPITSGKARGAGPGPTLTDIVEMRSIDSLSVSPSGRKIAFRVISPSVAQNATSIAWYSVALSGTNAPVKLGRDAEPIWMPLYDVVQDGVRQWSGDSSSLFVLQQQASAIQVHQLRRNGADDQLTNDDADIVTFTALPQGGKLDYQVRNTRAQIARAQEKEEREGIHLDRTVITDGLRLTRNFRIGNRETTIRSDDAGNAIEVDAGSLRNKEIALPAGTSGGRSPKDYINTSEDQDVRHTLKLGSSGMTIGLKRIAARDPVLLYARYQIIATLPDGSTRECRADFCSGLSPVLREVTVNPKSKEVVILYEKDFSARTGIYGWNPITGRTRTIVPPEQSLDGGSGYGVSACPKSGRYLICVFSGPTQPPRLIRIDMASGRFSTLYDPNLGLATKRYGEISFLEWKDSAGRAANGVLVLPENPTYPLPLVITTARCRGFLRGGTSALIAPEHILTEMGFAALCVNNNNANQFEHGADGKIVPLAMHKAALESYRAIIGKLAAEGIIDRVRVGIAGHSYGSMVAAYAISHSDLFAAASIGTGITIDPGTYFITAPVHDSPRKSFTTAMGLPKPNDDPHKIWNAISPALNAQRIRAPLLIQPPESEYLFGLQLYTYIQDAGGTVDMYIYPNEGHSSSRSPVHQYFRDKRSIAWFAKWLLPAAPQK